MKKNSIYAAFAVTITLLATACSKDDTALSTTEGQVTISTSLAGAATRTEQTYAPEGGKLTLLYSSLNATGKQQAEFICTAGKWEANPTLFWQELTPNDEGQYPFFAAAPAVPAAAPAVAADQSTTATYTASDQLMAYTVAQRKEIIALTFKHLLSQLTVTLSSTAAADPDYIDLSAATLTIDGARIAYNVSSTAPTTEVPAVATAAGDAATSLKPLVSEKDAARKHYLLLPPQTLPATSFTITATVGSNTYTWKAAAEIVLAAALNNTINLTVKKSAISLGGISVTDWDNSPAPINGSPTDPDILLPEASSLNLPEAGTLTLAAFKGDDKQGSNATYPVAYDASKPDGECASINTADADYAPIKWEDLPKYTAAGSNTLQTYAYTALFVPTAPAATNNHERQYLCGTSAATAWGTAPAFTSTDTDPSTDHRLKQLMSRLVVNLAFSDEFTADDKASATLSVVRKKKVTAVSLDNAAQANVTTADVTAADATVSLVPSATDALAFSATLCPQLLAEQDDKYITLTLNGGTATEQSYTLKAGAEGFTLAAGQQHTLTLTLSKTALTIGSLSIAPWTEATGDGNLDWE